MRVFSAASCFAIALALVPARADAITLREVIELTRAGLSEEVLLALIEIDPRVFPVDSATLRSLKDAGVSEKVIVAIVKSGRTPAPQPEPAPLPVDPTPPEPQIVVVERERPVVREVAVPVPVYVAVPVVRHSRSIHDDRSDHPSRNVASRKAAEPVYWGWGGKRRPDSWQPSPEERRPDQKR
jgi:hypothetical protein